MTRLRWPRRLSVLIALAALAAAAWGVSALQPEPTFGTPAPQPGDAWTYAASDANATEGLRHSTWMLRQVTLRMGGPAQALDADGQRVDGRLVVEERDLRHPEHPDNDDLAFPVARTHVLDAGGGVVATREDGSWGQGGVRNSITGPDGQSLGLEQHGVVRNEWRTGHGLAPLCGHQHSLQGRAAPLGTLRLDGACAALDGPDAPVTLRHRGEAEWQGRPVQRFTGSGVEAWLDPAIPVPVVLRFGGMAFELQGYGAGDAPAPHESPRDALPRVVHAPRLAWGLDESGVAHEFPLASAYAAALADPASGLPAFLAAHPQAQAVAAAFREVVYDDSVSREVRREWTLTVSDGAAAHAVVVRQAEPQARPPVPALPTQAVAPLRAITFEEADPGTGPWPSPAALPDALPTVASLLTRWEAQRTDPALAGNAWGFTATCSAPTQADCGDVSVQAWAGRAYTEWHDDVQVGFATMTSWIDVLSRSTVDAAGRSVEHREARDEETSYFQLGPIEDGVPPAAPRQEQALAALPGATRAVGVLTLAAAAGYALWLLAKLLPSLLFTRVEPAKVLEHPRRAALMQAIDAEPGIHFRDLARRTGLAAGTARHHLRALEVAGQLTVVQGPRYQCYFPRGQDRRLTAAAGLLKSPVARGIVQATGADALSGQDLAARLGVAPGAVSYHVQRLAEAGLVTQRRDGRALLVQATELGRSAAA